MYPSSHVGWHAVPFNSRSVQLPTAPLAGGDDASQNGTQIAGDKTPSRQTLGPDTANPWSHVGWHVNPLASSEVQFPTAPLAGGDDASQGGTYLENTYADPLLMAPMFSSNLDPIAIVSPSIDTLQPN